jgi:N6-adenosine-specific RNA methylase IME4
MTSTAKPAGTVSSATYAHPPDTVTNIFCISTPLHLDSTQKHSTPRSRATRFEYKTNIVWLKVRKDGGPDGRGVGFYYRNVTELVLFGTRGKLRTSQTGRRMVNLIATMKERHSKKPQELYDMIELCSPGPFLELFARDVRPGWTHWGDEVPTGKANGLAREKVAPRPMEDGMIRPYRVPQLPLFVR